MNEITDKYSADYDGFSLVSGGLIYSIMKLFQKSEDPRKSRRGRAFIFALITWLPLGVLAVFEGTIFPEAMGINFIQDFETHVRFLFAVPFLILIEKLVDSSFINYIKTSDNLIVDKQQPVFNKMVSNVNKLSNLYLPEIIILIIIYSLTFITWDDHFLIESSKNYLYNQQHKTLTLAGFYYLFVSFPIYQLLLFRWLWRFIIWVYSILKISSLTFQIEAVNIDQMAGLTYLNQVPMLFSYIFFALAAVLSSSLGLDIVFEGVSLKNNYLDILFFVILGPVLLYAPLLVFIPLLIETKSKAIHGMGNLVAKHNLDYMKKWVYNKPPSNEPILGSIDNSSLSDINAAYAPVIKMKLVPINFKMFLLSCTILLLPFIPLAFTYYSFTDLFGMIIKSAFG